MKDITPDEAQGLISKGNVTIIDVRTREEFLGGHITGAKNIDVGSSQFEKDLEKLDKNKCYIVNCQHGSRSSRAATKMSGLGFSDVNNLLGGLSAWEDTGLQIEK